MIIKENNKKKKLILNEWNKRKDQILMNKYNIIKKYYFFKININSIGAMVVSFKPPIGPTPMRRGLSDFYIYLHTNFFSFLL